MIILLQGLAPAVFAGYLDWDAKLEQRVAIKEYLPSEFSTRIPGQSRVSIFNGAKNEQFVSGLNKFVDEAKRLSKFQKEDGIVRIFDCIAENETAYIVMELLTGQALNEYLQENGNAVDRDFAIHVANEVGKALISMHNIGIVHRDGKLDRYIRFRRNSLCHAYRNQA